MKVSHVIRWALAFCAAPSMLFGCGGSQRLITPATTISAVRPDSILSGETLKSIKARSYCVGNKAKQSGDFHARGTASGPFSGTFTAKGLAGDSEARREPSLWYLDEHFTITSASQEISGHVRQGGAGKVVSCSKHVLSFEISSFPYKLKRHRGGTASVTLTNGVSRQTFTESFK